MEPSLPRSAVVGSGTRVNLAVTPEEELHEAATARAREEEDEFFEVVPQDETMKERHGEVHSPRHPEMLEFLMRKGSLL